MEIIKAKTGHLPQIKKIYASARAFMRKTGNTEQWQGGYPTDDIILKDINAEKLYLCTENSSVLAVFYFACEEDEAYAKIYEGEWLNAEKYGVVHRIAISDEARGKGVAAFCFDYALSQIGNIKIDTHRTNIPMQRALEKYGFKYCGIIYLKNGDERLAFQVTK